MIEPNYVGIWSLAAGIFCLLQNVLEGHLGVLQWWMYVSMYVQCI